MIMELYQLGYFIEIARQRSQAGAASAPAVAGFLPDASAPAIAFAAIGDGAASPIAAGGATCCWAV